jgi:hypothetical protein
VRKNNPFWKVFGSVSTSKQVLDIRFFSHLWLSTQNKMAKQIFINLAVQDPQRSMEFYSALGFTNNPQFSDDAGKCMVWSEDIFVMILSRSEEHTSELQSRHLP